MPNGTRRQNGNGGWHAIKISVEGMNHLLKSPQVTRAVEAKTVAMTHYAQDISITENAYYEAKVLYKDHPEWPARGFVVAENFKAVIDDMYHSTLLKVAAHFPSDAPFNHNLTLADQRPAPTAKSSTRKDGLWQDKSGRWRNQRGHYQKAPQD
jgi:hypothetical protein